MGVPEGERPKAGDFEPSPDLKGGEKSRVIGGWSRVAVFCGVWKDMVCGGRSAWKPAILRGSWNDDQN